MIYKFSPEECDHKNLKKEYYLGTQTGDWICCKCGETFAEKQKKEGK